jgi:hypothetical protein
VVVERDGLRIDQAIARWLDSKSKRDPRDIPEGMIAGLPHARPRDLLAVLEVRRVLENASGRSTTVRFAFIGKDRIILDPTPLPKDGIARITGQLFGLALSYLRLWRSDLEVQVEKDTMAVLYDGARRVLRSPGEGLDFGETHAAFAFEIYVTTLLSKGSDVGYGFETEKLPKGNYTSQLSLLYKGRTPLFRRDWKEIPR